MEDKESIREDKECMREMKERIYSIIREDKECKRENKEIIREDKKMKFCTGSSYKGERTEAGMMDGCGVYYFADGSVYEGNFKKGVFHGEGVIILPSQFKMRGNFVDGKCDNYQMEFADGIEYKEHDWEYCVYPDRRYAVCVQNGIPPIGASNLTSSDPPREIPDGGYDTEDGFFNPHYDYIWSAEDPSDKVRGVSSQERKWILKYCRHTKKEPVGFQQDIVDENVLALQTLFEPEEPECTCFASESSSSSSLYSKDSKSLALGVVGSSIDRFSQLVEEKPLDLEEFVRTSPKALHDLTLSSSNTSEISESSDSSTYSTQRLELSNEETDADIEQI